MTQWSQTRRRPCHVLSEITRTSQIAPRAVFPQYGVIFIVKWRGISGAIWLEPAV